MRMIRLAGWLAHWTEALIARPPDMVIGDPDRPYLLRWYLVPRNPFLNLYCHRILRSDDDRALHDHPWASLSLCLAGAMTEVLPARPGGTALRRRAIVAGDIVFRRPSQPHRLEIAPGGVCRTLFLTGPKLREWGFWCPQGWRHWREFTKAGDKGRIGRGCGE